MSPCLSLLFEMLVMSAEPIYPEKTVIRAYLETLEEWGRLSRGMIVKKDQLNLKYMPKLRNAVKIMESRFENKELSSNATLKSKCFYLFQYGRINENQAKE